MDGAILINLLFILHMMSICITNVVYKEKFQDVVVRHATAYWD